MAYLAARQANANPHAPIYLGKTITLTPSELDAAIKRIDDTDVVRINPSEHPWIGSATFIDQIAKLSPEMADIVRMKQKQLDEHFGWSFPSRSRQRGGLEATDGSNRHVNFQIKRMGSKWTFQFLGSFVKQTGTKVQMPSPSEADTLVIDGSTWLLSHGDLVIAQGRVP